MDAHTNTHKGHNGTLPTRNSEVSNTAASRSPLALQLKPTTTNLRPEMAFFFFFLSNHLLLD